MNKYYLYVKVIASEKRVFPFHRLGENVNGRGWRGTAIKRIKLVTQYFMSNFTYHDSVFGVTYMTLYVRINAYYDLKTFTT